MKPYSVMLLVNHLVVNKRVKGIEFKTNIFYITTELVTTQ